MTESGAPIYDQIYAQIKSHIISGVLQEDEALPSIRNLAKDLRISVITTKRAYDELEKEVIYTVAGKGCFVAPKNVELLREENLKKIEALMQQIIQLAATCNLSRQDIIDMFNIIGKAMNAIEITNLTKTYPGFTLDPNLTLPSGCILGLIGENGAGKSTTIRLILDMVHRHR